MYADAFSLGNEVCWIELLLCLLLRYSRTHYWYIESKAAQPTFKGYWNRETSGGRARKKKVKEKNPEEKLKRREKEE